MAKGIKTTFIISLFAMLLLLLLKRQLQAGWLLSLAITFGTISYHFGMRLLVGKVFDLFMHNRADYHKAWYQQKPWEARLYKKLRLKKWRDRMPTYDPESFSPDKHSWKEIVQAMCQAELVHETIAAMSFLPLVAIRWFGAPAVFVITSVLAALFDLSFAAIQRYNRPRVLRIAQKAQGDLDK